MVRATPNSRSFPAVAPYSNSNQSPLGAVSVSGKRNFEARDKGAEIALRSQCDHSQRPSAARETANSAVFAKSQEISVRLRLRGGPGRTRTSNQAVIGCARRRYNRHPHQAPSDVPSARGHRVADGGVGGLPGSRATARRSARAQCRSNRLVLACHTPRSRFRVHRGSMRALNTRSSPVAPCTIATRMANHPRRLKRPLPIGQEAQPCVIMRWRIPSATCGSVRAMSVLAPNSRQ